MPSVFSYFCPRYLFAERIVLSRLCPRYLFAESMVWPFMRPFNPYLLVGYPLFSSLLLGNVGGELVTNEILGRCTQRPYHVSVHAPCRLTSLNCLN